MNRGPQAISKRTIGHGGKEVLVRLPDWLFDRLFDPEASGFLEVTKRSPRTKREWTFLRVSEDEAIEGIKRRKRTWKKAFT